MLCVKKIITINLIGNLYRTVVAATICPERTSVSIVKNKIARSVNSMKPRITLRMKIDFRSADISKARAALTTN